jgi:cell division septation protein DedD
VRQIRADVSHRIRRREPSIFAAWWFRLVLGTGIALALGLAVGPSVAGWLRGTPAPAPVSVPAASVAPAPKSDAAVPVASPPAPPLTPVAAPAAPAVPTAEVRSGPAPPPPPVVASRTPASAPNAPAKDGPDRYRIQLGAFVDHRNADRLVQRLRDEGFGAETSVVEQPRLVYRVLLDAAEPVAVAERVRGLGFPAAEVTAGGVAVSGPSPREEAVEISKRLRELGMVARLQEEPGTATFRVVRVGAYGKSDDAEAGVRQLKARGFEGFVVRER